METITPSSPSQPTSSSVDGQGNNGVADQANSESKVEGEVAFATSLGIVRVLIAAAAIGVLKLPSSHFLLRISF